MTIKRKNKLIGLMILSMMSLLALMSACAPVDNRLPTVAILEEQATSIALTQNAPPAGFDVIRLPAIDANLTRLAGWRYTLLVTFEGVFARTTRETRSTTQLEVSYHLVASARRVVTRIEGELQGQAPPVQYEAVRLGEDTFLVRDGVCLSNAGQDAAIAADLSAGSLIGGILQAEAAAQSAVINNETAWRYNFDVQDLSLPILRLGGEGKITGMSGDLWFSPQRNAVIRYHVNLDVEDAYVFGSSLPVTGRIIIRYDVEDIGTVPNLSIPFGC